MKKRILSMILAIIMAMVILPDITVFAADTGIYVGGVELKDGQYVTNNSTTAVTGTPDVNSTGYAYFENNVLVMNSYNYSGTGDTYNSAAVYSTDTFAIQLEGVNTLDNTSAYGYGLCGGAYADIAISGTGSLEITGAGYDGIRTGGTVSVDSDVSVTANERGIYADQVYISGGTVNISANDEYAGIDTIYDTIISGGSVTVYSKYGDGIISDYGDVLITEAAINVEAGYYGINADGDIVMDNCNKVAIKTSDNHGIYAQDAVEITNCSDVEIQSVYEQGIRAKDVITICKSNVKVTSGDYGIYTNNDDAEIIIKEQSTVTIDAGDDGIRTGKADSSVTISDSTVNIINCDYGIHTKGSSISITGGVVNVTAQDEYGLSAKGSVTIDGSQTRVNITSTAVDADGIHYGGALYMDGGWLNNNGNHTVASSAALDSAFAVDANRTLTIYPGVVLTVQAGLTNNGIIENSGTLIIPTSVDLAGNGNISAGGTFQIASYLDGEIHVPEDLVYTGENLTDDAKAKISLYESITLQNTVFTYLNRDEWSLSIEPEPVKDAGDYNAVYTRGTNVIKKKFTVDKADGPNAPVVNGNHTNDGMTYTYIVNTIDGAQYSKDGLTWQDSNVFSDLAPGQQYTFYARIKETDNYKAGVAGNSGAVNLSKLPGVGTVSIEGWIYGEMAKSPVSASDTNGTDNVTYLYKVKDADDSTYKSDVPTKVGDYTIKASFAATETHEATSATADFTIVNIDASIEGITEENVKSTDKAAVQEVIDKAEKILEEDDLTFGEKLVLKKIKKNAEKLMEIIEKAANAAETENIKKIENITSDNVTLNDKNDLEKAKNDLEKALEENGGNYTDDEKAAIEEKIKCIDEALQVIENAEAVENMILDLPQNITKDDEAKIIAADKAFKNLSDYEKSLVDAAVKKILDNAKMALEELSKPTSPNTGDDSNIWVWFALLCVSGAAVFGISSNERKKI